MTENPNNNANYFDPKQGHGKKYLVIIQYYAITICPIIHSDNLSLYNLPVIPTVIIQSSTLKSLSNPTVFQSNKPPPGYSRAVWEDQLQAVRLNYTSRLAADLLSSSVTSSI